LTSLPHRCRRRCWWAAMSLCVLCCVVLCTSGHLTAATDPHTPRHTRGFPSTSQLAGALGRKVYRCLFFLPPSSSAAHTATAAPAAPSAAPAATHAHGTCGGFMATQHSRDGVKPSVATPSSTRSCPRLARPTRAPAPRCWQSVLLRPVALQASSLLFAECTWLVNVAKEADQNP
jgi:hypothetical protein